MRQRIVRALRHISTLPGGFVDVGADQVIAAARGHIVPVGGPLTMAEADARQEADAMHAYLADVDAWIAPHHLPDDYRFFLANYGGAHIKMPTHYWDISGTGLTRWYQYPLLINDEFVIDREEYPSETGWLTGGILTIYTNEPPHFALMVYFYMDLRGNIDPYCVIAIPRWGPCEEGLGPQNVLARPFAHKNCWTRTAGSFTEWLEKAATTQGTFGYL